MELFPKIIIETNVRSFNWDLFIADCHYNTSFSVYFSGLYESCLYDLFIRIDESIKRLEHDLSCAVIFKGALI